MGEPESGATDCLLAYAKQCGISIDLQSDPMGIGEDGIVWKSSRLTALKAFYREKNFLKELDCYERLAEFGVTEVAGFTVPELLGKCGQFLVLELGIVAPPRLLDFGKAYLDWPGPLPSDVLEEHLQLRSDEYSESDWDRVMDAFYELKQYGIYYYDLRPANIQMRGE